MGTILKYIIYILLIAIVYFIIMGVWDKKITEESTVKEVVNQVSDDMGNTAQKVMDNEKNTTQAQ